MQAIFVLDVQRFISCTLQTAVPDLGTCVIAHAHARPMYASPCICTAWYQTLLLTVSMMKGAVRSVVHFHHYVLFTVRTVPGSGLDWPLSFVVGSQHLHARQRMQASQV